MHSDLVLPQSPEYLGCLPVIVHPSGLPAQRLRDPRGPLLDNWLHLTQLGQILLCLVVHVDLLSLLPLHGRTLCLLLNWIRVQLAVQRFLCLWMLQDANDRVERDRVRLGNDFRPLVKEGVTDQLHLFLPGQPVRRFVPANQRERRVVARVGNVQLVVLAVQLRVQGLDRPADVRIVYLFVADTAVLRLLVCELLLARQSLFVQLQRLQMVYADVLNRLRSRLLRICFLGARQRQQTVHRPVLSQEQRARL